jgi:acyl-CoA thioester hydrolase
MNTLISETYSLRSRYGEVDAMGYIYHAHYVSYCHQARTELMRKLCISDKALEEKGIMMPDIDFSIKYKIPGLYDEELTIKTSIYEIPKIRLTFHFEIRNSSGKVQNMATSTVVFVDKTSRRPMPIPPIVRHALVNSYINGVFIKKLLKKPNKSTRDYVYFQYI